MTNEQKTPDFTIPGYEDPKLDTTDYGSMKIALMGLLPVFLIGLFSMIGGAFALQEYVVSQIRWESTTGVVDSTAIMTRYERGRYSCNCDKFWLDLDYRYEVNGHTYTNERVNFRDRVCVGDTCFGGESIPNSIAYSRDPLVAEQAFSDYAIGSPITVYYDPRSPQISVLEREVWPYAYPIFGVGLVLVILIGGYWVSKLPA